MSIIADTTPTPEIPLGDGTLILAVSNAKYKAKKHRKDHGSTPERRDQGTADGDNSILERGGTTVDI